MGGMFAPKHYLQQFHPDYADADALLHHLENVAELIGEVLGFAELERLEIHGVASEIDKLREPMSELSPEFFELEFGFRR